MAEKLGMPVGEMLRRMTSAEVTEWMAYFDLQGEPEKQGSVKDYFSAKFADRVKKK